VLESFGLGELEGLFGELVVGLGWLGGGGGSA